MKLTEFFKEDEKSLSSLAVGKRGIISRIVCEDRQKTRLLEMGVTPKTEVLMRMSAPSGDPIRIYLRGYDLTLRKSEADNIYVRTIK